MTTRKDIEQFLDDKTFAIAGVSRNPSKFGHMVYRDLKKWGYRVFPINPNAEAIDGDRCYKSLSDLPAGIDHLLILTPRKETDQVLKEAIKKGITRIWVQQMSETKDTLRLAEEYNIDIIHKRCIYMFAEPVAGIHKFHKTLMKIFGRLPK